MASSSTSSSTKSSSSTTSKEHSQTQSKSESISISKNVLDEALRDEILSGLIQNMTDEEINAYATNLLAPQLNAAIEASQQNYETTRLGKEQEIANLAQELSRSITQQQEAYRRSTANVEAAALARGMGRSSYTLQTLANQGDALAKATRELTDENTRKSAQIQAQITQAAQQNSQTLGRLNTDFASQVAAKVQELKESQRKEYNSNYLTAISAAMGKQTTGTQTGSSTTDSTGSSKTEGTSSTNSTTTSGGGGGGRKSSVGTYFQNAIKKLTGN